MRSLTSSVAIVDLPDGIPTLNLNNRALHLGRRDSVVGLSTDVEVARREEAAAISVTDRAARFARSARSYVLINSKPAEQKLRGSDRGVNVYSFRRVY